MAGSVILTGARTPIGKMSGQLSGFSAAQLGGLAIKAALERAGLTGDQVDYVFTGHVLGAGAGQITARRAALAGGIPLNVPSTTVNKVCLSGINSIMLADMLINSGQADIVIAGGMESMTQAPYLLPSGRAGARYGNTELQDTIVADGLFCAIDEVLMGAGTEKYAQSASISREAQDQLAAASHDKAARAQKDGLLDAEIVAVEIPQRKGEPIIMTLDDGVRAETTFDGLSKLRPAFDKAGNITAGNASQISDAGPDASLLTQPSRAISRPPSAPVSPSATSTCSS